MDRDRGRPVNEQLMKEQDYGVTEIIRKRTEGLVLFSEKRNKVVIVKV